MTRRGTHGRTLASPACGWLRFISYTAASCGVALIAAGATTFAGLR